ncbi:hypothetical protein [Persicobacter sp. CCB-QB2]|uniref:hypothetical protein n=1 Tax=Persicobacter sp. CCB-QB2 TaxID=1561025 RepID=UPI0006A96AD6|nr:hypothetical protein [Persicobacter sp. CCB-QB2]
MRRHSIFLLGLIFFISCKQAQKQHPESAQGQYETPAHETIHPLTASFWRLYENEMIYGEKHHISSKNQSLCYYPDGRLFFNGVYGSWVLDDEVVKHQLNREDEVAMNFGGDFIIENLTDSSLVITKLMDSKGEMKRRMYFKASKTLTPNPQPHSGAPYHFLGELNQQLLDSLHAMSKAALFDAGFTILRNDMIHILKEDTLHIIGLNQSENWYQKQALN